jgi:GWxTD domain-containing protein
MKLKTLIFFIVGMMFSMMIRAQEETQKDIAPFFSMSSFFSPQQGPYIETYLTILGHSLYFNQKTENKYEAAVEVTIFVKQNNEIIDFKKYTLRSPEVEDTTSVNFSLIDIQRFVLPKGDYQLEVKLVDLYSPIEPLMLVEEFSIEYDNMQISVSGIQLIERYSPKDEETIFTKAGYELIPLPLNFYPKSVHSIIFYCETYNSDKILGDEEPLLIQSHIQHFETGNTASNFQSFKRERAKNVIPHLQQFDIEQLPSGNYFLVVEVRNKNNELMASNRLFFQRSNPDADINYLTTTIPLTNTFVVGIQSKDTLLEFIRSTRPIATENEKYFIDRQANSSNLERLQQFFLTFWQSRGSDPDATWRNYYTEVLKTQTSFSTKIKKGYETDRGRVYLQYGAPNTIVSRDNEPSTYPYEIWHYYSLNNQRNRRFVFYNRDLATNDYELLHSDAIGEIQDLQWQLKLNQRNFATNDPDFRSTDWGWGSKIEDYWTNPR